MNLLKVFLALCGIELASYSLEKNTLRENLEKIPSHKILNIGAGSGLPGQLTYVGEKCDIAPSPELGVNYCDATRLPFSNKQYDVAILSHVLEHLPPNEAKKALCEAKRVAKKVYVLTPSYIFPMAWLNPGHKSRVVRNGNQLLFERNPVYEFLWKKG